LLSKTTPSRDNTTSSDDGGSSTFSLLGEDGVISIRVPHHTTVFFIAPLRAFFFIFRLSQHW